MMKMKSFCDKNTKKRKRRESPTKQINLEVIINIKGCGPSPLPYFGQKLGSKKILLFVMEMEIQEKLLLFSRK